MNSSVFILHYVPIHVGEGLPSRGIPGEIKGIPFKTLPRLKQHVCDLVNSKIEYLDKPFQVAFHDYRKAGRIDDAIKIWRTALEESKTAFPFNVYWDDKPEVVL